MGREDVVSRDGEDGAAFGGVLRVWHAAMLGLQLRAAGSVERWITVGCPTGAESVTQDGMWG